MFLQYSYRLCDHACIAMGNPSAGEEEIRAAARAAELHELLETLPRGYDTPVGELGGRLSGGERQRVAIARAILKDAPVVFLDEATANLDTLSERAIHRTMENVFADKTVVTVAHRLSTVVGSDVIHVMEGGRIVESGSHRDLIASEGVYASVVEKQRDAMTEVRCEGSNSGDGLSRVIAPYREKTAGG